MKRHSSSSSKFDLKSLLRNRNVLYLVLFLAVMNLFSYLMLKQLDAVAFFLIIGFLSTYFSKNMIVVMLTSMVSTFLLVQIKLLGGGKEGMETMATGTDSSGNSMAPPSKNAESDSTAAAALAGMTADTISAAPKASINPIPDAALAAITTSEIPLSSAQRAALTTPISGTLAANSKNKPESFQQQLNPARFNANDDNNDSPRHKPNIDYAATLESAYDNLDKLLSSDAIRNMSADTGRLAEKQQQLMGNIDKMTPIMEKAGNILGKLDIGGIMGGLHDKLKSFEKMKPKGIMDETTA
jgi:hypothetical protein